MKYKAYPEYKDSGVEWLGKVPSHWFSTKIKYGYKITLGKMLQKDAKTAEDKLKSYLKAANVQPQGLSLNAVGEMWFSPSDMRSLRLCRGDVLISEGGDVGRAAIWRDELPECYIQNAINRARPLRNRSSCYLFYWINMLKESEYIDILCNKATIAHYTAEKVEASPLFLPPDDEADEIANFLDHETAKIDTLIEKQQQLIKLLKEKRQAVISHAVTKGLNPNAPMRDSGVEWVGEVPEHWEVKRVRHAFQIDNNLRTPIDRQSRMEMVGSYEYYGPTGVLNLINRYNVEGEYFLLGEDGDHFLKFKDKAMTIQIEGRFNVNNHAHLIKGKGSCSTEWGCLYFEHKDLFPWLIKQGVGRYKLQKTVLMDIPIHVPPENEQRFIINEIKKKKLAFSQIESRAESLTTILREHRTALVSAAVTGKVDVRPYK